MEQIKVGDGATECHLFFGYTPATVVGVTVSGDVVESITVAPERLVMKQYADPSQYEFELIPDAPTRTYVFEDGQYRCESYTLRVGARYWGDMSEDEDYAPAPSDPSINFDEPLY
jgi:hypothetical protein